MTRKWRTTVERAESEQAAIEGEPARISFTGMPRSATVERMCDRELAKLRRYAPRIVGCSVVVARSQNRHRRGARHEVRIRVHSPRVAVAVTRVPEAHSEAETLELAVREAFDRARRRLQDALRKLRGDVKPTPYTAAREIRGTRKKPSAKAAAGRGRAGGRGKAVTSS